ncbi:hypothetical protein VPH35_051636 [Triticum aestivum]
MTFLYYKHVNKSETNQIFHKLKKLILIVQPLTFSTQSRSSHLLPSQLLPSMVPPLPSTAASGPSSPCTSPPLCLCPPPPRPSTSTPALATQGTEAQSVSAAAAVVSSPLGNTDAHEDNKDYEGSFGPEIVCLHSQEAVARQGPHAGRRHPPLLLVTPCRPRLQRPRRARKNGWVYMEDEQVHRLLTILDAAPM